MEESRIVTIIEAELDWSSRHNKTFRFHTVEAAINKVLEAELQDLSKSFVDEQDYKGYMVKQVIDARLDSSEQSVLDGGNSSKASVGVKPETTSEVTNACHQSLRKDGDHSWYPNRDDPIIICLWCKQTRDALTGKTI